MKKLVDERLPEISPEVSRFLNGSLDFVGINHYTSLYAKNDRTRIRKFILQDASSDAAVITSCKLLNHYLLCLYNTIGRSFERLELTIVLHSIVASRNGIAIGERV